MAQIVVADDKVMQDVEALKKQFEVRYRPSAGTF
jgi:hypothetical protein